MFDLNPVVYFIIQTFLFSIQAGRGADDDYWTEDFNTHKNCQQEKKIAKLTQEVGAHTKIVLVYTSQVLTKLFAHFAGK